MFLLSHTFLITCLVVIIHFWLRCVYFPLLLSNEASKKWFFFCVAQKCVQMLRLVFCFVKEEFVPDYDRNYCTAAGGFGFGERGGKFPNNLANSQIGCSPPTLNRLETSAVDWPERHHSWDKKFNSCLFGTSVNPEEIIRMRQTPKFDFILRVIADRNKAC
jgi:hypothetical protein